MLKKDLGSSVSIIGVRTQSNNEGWKEFCSEVELSIQARRTSQSAPMPLAVLIKNPARIDALAMALASVNAGALRQLRVLVVDDEADQASPDATLGKPPSVRPRTNPKSVHESLKKLADSITGKVVYLSYTATPQAILHQERGSLLMPKYCSIVPSGPGYFGLSDLFTSPWCRADVDALASEERGTWEEQNSAVLMKIFTEFLVKAWAHRTKKVAFHDGFAGCKSMSVQMLIHPSGVQEDHRIAASLITAFRSSIQEILADPNIRVEFLSAQVAPMFMQVLDDLGFADAFKENLHDFLDFYQELIRNDNLLRIRIINTNQRSKLKAAGRESEFIPVEDSDWDSAPAWILIGGDILGRGLTIPHLVTTYFIRNPRSPLFDTSVQQMRFCGYRKNYSKMIRVYAPGDVLNSYADNNVSDADFRYRAEIWDSESVDLENHPPKVIHIRPKDAVVRATRNSVISRSVRSTSNSDLDGFSTFDSVLSSELTLARVGEVQQIWVEACGMSPVSGRLTLDYSYFPRIIDALEEPENQVNYLALRELSADLPSLMQVIGSEFDLHIDPGFGLSTLGSFKTLIEDPARLESSRTMGSYRYRTADFSSVVGSFEDWKTGHGKDGVFGRIKALVGDSERNLRRGKEDRTLILIKPFAIHDSYGNRVALACAANVWLPKNAPVFSVNMDTL